ncbi:MAG TPA: AraC family transcriptional regulator [Bryobacteraceae bacterium]|nr:AraC family transcriptional regulator [Bryobacteraceae bacterium]
MADRFRVLSVMGRQLEELGISTNAVLRLAGLPSELFQQIRIWLTTDEMRALYNAIAEVSGDQAIGLKLGAEERPEYYSPITIAALFTRSFRDALNRAARYKKLTSPQEIRISERGKEYAVEFVWLLAEVTESPIWIDSCFSWTVMIGRRGIGRSIHPLRVELRRPTANKQPYENFFACPVRFGARHNRLFFRVEDIDQPFITSNPDLLELIAPQLEAELRQHLMNKSLKEQAKGILKRSLAGQPPRLEDVAAELRMGARTLQRKLLEEGATFHTLMEEARHEMAQHYLRQRSLELNETAYLLGYEDPNSFIRAFHKWEGTSPGEWRSIHSETIQ